MTRLKDISQKLESPNESDRQAGIIELVRLGDLRVVPVLKRIIGRDQSTKVRHSARKALTILQKHVSSDLEKKSNNNKQINLNALQSMLYSKSEVKRCQGVDAAVKYNDPRAVKLLYKRLKIEESLRVCKSLLLGLAILGQKDSVKVLSEYLSHKDPDIRIASVEALAYIKDESIIPYLLISFQDSDKKVREETLVTINSLPPNVQINAFKDILINREDRVRIKVLDLLYILKKEYTVPLLAMALRIKSNAISDKARDLLTKLSSQEFENAHKALKSMEELIDAPPTKIIKKYTIATKEDLKNKKPMDKVFILHKLINDNRTDRISDIHRIIQKERDIRVLSKAIMAAGVLGNNETPALLLDFLGDSDDRIRANTVEALFRLDKVNYQNLFLPLLKDINNRVRANSIIALHSSHNRESVRTLRKMVSSSELKDRLSSIYVISDIMDESFCGLLEGMLMDIVPEVRNRAADCLRIFSQKGILTADTILKSFEDKRNQRQQSNNEKNNENNINKNSEASDSNTTKFSINICPYCGFENDGWRIKCRKCKASLRSQNKSPKPQIKLTGSYKRTNNSKNNQIESTSDSKNFLKDFFDNLNKKSSMERLVITSLIMFVLIYLPLLVIMLLQKYIFIN